MKKRILIALATIAFNVAVIATIFSDKAYAEQGLWTTFDSRKCWCPGHSYPEEQLCEAADCVGGELWVCLTSWPPIPCGEPFNPPAE
jgi:hypothetical protein